VRHVAMSDQPERDPNHLPARLLAPLEACARGSLPPTSPSCVAHRGAARRRGRAGVHRGFQSADVDGSLPSKLHALCGGARRARGKRQVHPCEADTRARETAPMRRRDGRRYSIAWQISAPKPASLSIRSLAGTARPATTSLVDRLREWGLLAAIAPCSISAAARGASPPCSP